MFQRNNSRVQEALQRDNWNFLKNPKTKYCKSFFSDSVTVSMWSLKIHIFIILNNFATSTQKYVKLQNSTAFILYF